MFKLDIGNDLGISYKWIWFWIERSKVNVRLGITAIRRGFELYECLLLSITFDIPEDTSIYGVVSLP